MNKFSTLKMPKPEKIAKDIVEEMIRFREYIPVIRAICNPGLKDRHFEDIRILMVGLQVAAPITHRCRSCSNVVSS